MGERPGEPGPNAGPDWAIGPFTSANTMTEARQRLAVLETSLRTSGRGAGERHIHKLTSLVAAAEAYLLCGHGWVEPDEPPGVCFIEFGNRLP